MSGPATRACLIELRSRIEALRERGDDYIIIAVGVRGPNHDCPHGNAVATVRVGHDEATCEALYLPDAISLARGKALRERKAREKAKEQAA